MHKYSAQIDEYRAAYEAANGYPFSRHIEYRNGWFVFANVLDGEMVCVDKYRKDDIERMTRTLRLRAAG